MKVCNAFASHFYLRGGNVDTCDVLWREMLHPENVLVAKSEASIEYSIFWPNLRCFCGQFCHCLASLVHRLGVIFPVAHIEIVALFCKEIMIRSGVVIDTRSVF